MSNENNVLKIVDGVVEECLDKKVKSVVIPGGVTTIREFAFGRCDSLETVIIPASVKTIEALVFFDCKSLEMVKFAGTEKQWKKVKKGFAWNVGVPAKAVNCISDNLEHFFTGWFFEIFVGFDYPDKELRARMQKVCDALVKINGRSKEELVESGNQEAAEILEKLQCYRLEIEYFSIDDDGVAETLGLSISTEEVLETDCYRNAFFPMFAKYLSRETGIPVGILYDRWPRWGEEEDVLYEFCCIYASPDDNVRKLEHSFLGDEYYDDYIDYRERALNACFEGTYKEPDVWTEVEGETFDDCSNPDTKSYKSLVERFESMPRVPVSNSFKIFNECMKKYLVPYSDEHSNVKIVWDKKRGDFIPLSDQIYRHLE